MADQTSLYTILVTDPVSPDRMNQITLDVNARLQQLEEGGASPVMMYRDGSLVGLGGGTLVRLAACPYKMKNILVGLGCLTVPVGQDLIVDIFGGVEPGGGAPGTSIFAVNPKPKIIASSTSGLSDDGAGNVFFAADSNAVINKGQSIGVVIDQVGNVVPGDDLAVTIIGEPTT